MQPTSRGTHLIRPVPHRSPDTPLHLPTRPHDRLKVPPLLLQPLLVRGQRREPHVELRDRDLDARRRELLQVALDVRERGHLPYRFVHLHPDAVYGDAGGFEVAHERLERGGFGAGRGRVVLVDAELGVRVSEVRGVQREWDVGGVESVVPDRLAPGAVVVEGLWKEREDDE